MSDDKQHRRRTAAERVDDLPAIQGAMVRAVRAALRRHKRAGNPVVTWRDGALVRVAPEDIPVDVEEPLGGSSQVGTAGASR
jgi:hypothetical protein